MSWLIWSTIIYRTACGIYWTAIHCDFQPHKDGCTLCKRYGEFCGCGYSFLNMRVYLERFKNWLEQSNVFDRIEKIAVVGKVFTGIGLAIFILIIPTAAFVVVAVTHILNPWHRKRCLSDVLNPPTEVTV